MNMHKINKINYYLIDDINSYYPGFKKIYESDTDLITRYNINKNNYTYSQLLSNKTLKLDKLFIRCKWFNNYFTQKELEESENIEDMPPKIHLIDDEKFKDDNGNIYDIETRGNRDYNEYYFNIEDVALLFKIPNLKDKIIKSNTLYEKNKDYKYFKKNIREKKLYLTYNGILRVLFTSRNKSVEKFRNWATKTLFTAQMGTNDQKTKLASELLGIDNKTLQSILKTTSGISCLYLFNIGPVSDLRTKYNIDDTINDENCVAKFGRTNKLARRLTEHMSNYGNDIELLIFEYIDEKLLVEAEASLKKYFKATNTRLITDREDELIIVNKESLKLLKDQYRMIGTTYRGEVGENINVVKDLISKHEKELMMKDKEISDIKHKNDILVSELKHEKELALKDNEYLKLKLELVELKLKKNIKKQ